MFRGTLLRCGRGGQPVLPLLLFASWVDNRPPSQTWPQEPGVSLGKEDPGWQRKEAIELKVATSLLV